MNTKRILLELHAERSRIDRAIAAIQAIHSDGARPAARVAAPKRRRSRMSAAARKRLSELMKKRWAQGKMKARGKTP